MRSYRDLAEDAGVTVEAVRDAMGRAERHEIPYTRMLTISGTRRGRSAQAEGRAGRVAPGRMIRATPQDVAGQGV